MKALYLFLFILFFSFSLHAQKYWTGTGISGQWNDGNNWSGGVVPSSTDDVILDNSFVTNSYVVNLPSVATTTTVRTLLVNPSAANIITLIIPSTNTADTGLYLTGAGDALILNNNAVLQNSTGAPGGAIGLIVANTFRINNNGHYIHNNARAIAAIVSQLSTATGTENGIFEYDVPTTISFSGSFSNRKYGTLVFSSAAAGGSKTYTGTGATDLTIRGNLIINAGANFDPSMTANINVAGNFTVTGNFSASPSSSASIGRSLIFNGTTNQTISGGGNLTFGANFRNIKFNKNSAITLARDITLNNNDSIIVDTSATLNLSTYKLNGASNFLAAPLSHILIGDANGINLVGNNSGNIQTTSSRVFDTAAIYEYNGTGAQATGSALPSSVKNLIINKPDYSSLTLINSVNINDTLNLQKGFLTTANTSILKLRDTTAILSQASNYSSCCSINNIGWEKSFINGPAIIEINSTIPKWLPVGKIKAGVLFDTLFAPVKLTKYNSTLVSDTVEYFAISYIDTITYHLPLDHISTVEYWSIGNNSTAPSNTAQVTLSWRKQSKTGNGNSSLNTQALNDLRIAHYIDDDGVSSTPPKWNIDGGSSSAFTISPNSTVDYGLITSNNFIEASSFFTLGTISTYNLLPLKLIDFTGNKKSSAIQLTWMTEDESSIKKYLIERSDDGKKFNEIASVNSLKKKEQYVYAAFDNNPLHTSNYYRLKIIDEQNKIYYSRIIKVLFEENNNFLVYPNPAQKEIYIQVDPSSSIYEIEIVNSSGQIVLQKKIFENPVKINIEFLAKGIYTLRLRNQQENIFQKLIKQ